MVPVVVIGPPLNPVPVAMLVTVPVLVVYPASFVKMETGSAGWTAVSAFAP